MRQGIVRIRAEARRDLDRHSDCLLAEAGVESASKFVEAARHSFGVIAQSPHLGPALRSSNPRMAEMRKWRVSGFSKFLIFYQPMTGGVRIVRVLHSAQDWSALFDTD